MKALNLRQLLLVVLSVLIMVGPVVLADDDGPQQSTAGPVPPKTVQERDVIQSILGVPPVAPVVIPGVPDYTWRHGCGPTAVGNVIGYYDGKGYDDLIPGNAANQTPAVDQAIASGGPPPLAACQHYEDYSLPIDNPPNPLMNDAYITAGVLPHVDNCIADYQDTSKSTRANRYGWSWSSDLGPSFVGYVNQQNSTYNPTFTEYKMSTGALTWNVLTNEIDNGRPMVFLVDTDGNGRTDHFIAIVGYDTATNQYGCHDSWNPPFGVRWEKFQQYGNGIPWGIWAGWSLHLSPLDHKWKQPPDETENGIDIRCDQADGIARVLADDYKCTKAGPITKVIFWGSWKNDIKGQITNIHLSIHNDNPKGPNGWSEPNELKWEGNFGPAAFTETLESTHEPEWCWDPASAMPPTPWCDYNLWRYEIAIDPCKAFIQQGEPGNPVTYWLDIHVKLQPDERMPEFGWKTSTKHWNDDAVFSDDDGSTWKELRYQPGHPYYPNSIDLSFAIITEPNQPSTPNNIKWSQPPIPTEPENLYYGWNEISVYDGTQIVADDWQCENDDPITDIHWWGSFQTWTDSIPPQMPDSFHITIWNDVPAKPDDPLSFSHPNEVVWEIDCTNFMWSFDGWDYDPRTGCYEACFYFEQFLNPSEYFFQEPSPIGSEPKIYWISIAAQYPAGAIVNNPWGWKARPRVFNDDAVRIFTPTKPIIGDKYINGEPIWWPNPEDSWDMAFELTAESIGPITKWEQKPNKDLPGLHCHDDRSAGVNYYWLTKADDWECKGGEVTDLHWYGNYENMGSGIEYFHLSIHAASGVACLPGPLLWDHNVPFADITEIDTGIDNIDGARIYKYEYDLVFPFDQVQGDYYWFDLCAFSNDPMNPAIWRWQEHQRSPAPNLCGAAKRTDPGGTWQTITWTMYPTIHYSDMAFEVTSVGVSEFYVKWSQPPEPYLPPAYDGWNELSVYNWNQIAADDWFCDTDSPVTDIHWWGSYIGWSCEHEPPVVPDSFHIAIWTDVPANPFTGEPSHPGQVIWETVCKEFTSVFDGWDIDPRIPDVPPSYYNTVPEACFKYEQDLQKFFKQKPGGNIYWLSIAAMYPSGVEVEYPWGWKTRKRDLKSLAPDDAVRIFDPTAPVFGSVYADGYPIYWPGPDDSWDLAFELTTKKIPPKEPVPHLKWSQPPIEIDPNSTEPVYSGWDEPSFREWIQPVWFDCWNCPTQCHGDADCNDYVGPLDLQIVQAALGTAYPDPAYNPCADFDRNLTVDLSDMFILQQNINTNPDPNCDPRPQYWRLVADDFRCLGSMPITSIHWWGSYFGLEEPGATPPELPIAWRIGFWSNVPADSTGTIDYSYPEKLLWHLKVPADKVEVEEVGTDFYHHYYPNDVAYQYTLYLEPNDFFWQSNFLNKTKDSVFWLSIAAVYDPCHATDPLHPWGWKTRPWHWMDDAVTFWLNEPIKTGMLLDPWNIMPIKDPIYLESFDVAFELDTDPNWIKWEQPFTGIRRWPHYEDERSMATEITTTEVVTKWSQQPDLTEMGVDVDATTAPAPAPMYPPQLLADDFNCVTTETITGIHIYGSWRRDMLPHNDAGMPDASQVQFTLSFHNDLPIGDPLNPNTWSMPGDLKWLWTFMPGEFSFEPMTAPTESYYMPCIDMYEPHDHQMVWKYSFDIDPANAFLQEGTPGNPLIYWLDVQARPMDVMQDPEVRFGWKTSLEHWNDDAVWIIGEEDIPAPGDWKELMYPPGHPLHMESMDLAFELTAERTNTEINISRLVADDWKCKRKTPVTAVVWWGSYIGYQYKPCHGQLMTPPIKPDYFLLNIWTDVPADVDSTVPFSHPNEIIWEYKAYKYDEVLVGYDKHPHTPGSIQQGHEPVFRYSVKLPKDDWFKQKDVNDIFWLSVVAVYKDPLPVIYPWGWTNHPHAFNDDAVAGHFDPAVGTWTWNELFDQNGDTEDMSFILFTDPDPILGTCWDAVECAGQPQGDATCNGMVNLGDLLALKAAWGTSAPWTPPFCCADFNQSGAVNLGDLLILKAGWGSGPHIPSTNSQSCP